MKFSKQEKWPKDKDIENILLCCSAKDRICIDALSKLRKIYPKKNITVLAREWTIKEMKTKEELKSGVVYRNISAGKSLNSLWNISCELKKMRFDMSIFLFTREGFRDLKLIALLNHSRYELCLNKNCVQFKKTRIKIFFYYMYLNMGGVEDPESLWRLGQCIILKALSLVLEKIQMIYIAVYVFYRYIKSRLYLISAKTKANNL